MTKTKIEWTERSWNPVTGCVKISQGCKNCYAEGIAKRFWGERPFKQIEFHQDRLIQPFQWKQPARVFVNSMSDLFQDNLSFDYVSKIIDVIRWTPQHTYMVLTKRPELMYRFFTEYVKRKYFIQSADFENLANLWLGVSVEDQETADERIPWLLKTPAAVRFISAEPLLEEIDIYKYLHKSISVANVVSRTIYFEQKGEKPMDIEYLDEKLNWVIAGAESGPKRRTCKTEWIEKIVWDCNSSEVPVFVKQIEQDGKTIKDIKKFPETLRKREYPQISQINTKE